MTTATRFGTAEYRIEQCHRHLDNFEGQLRGIPDNADPGTLLTLANRLVRLESEVINAMNYAETCRERKAEADLRVDALIEATRRAA